MAILRHEAWRYGDGSLGFGLADPESHARLESISGPATFLYAVHAETHEAAMQQHYDRQGWGAYRPVPGTTAEAYAATALKRQLDAYPDDQELIAKNLG